MRKSYWKFALPTLGLGVSLGLLGSAAPSIVCVTNRTSFALQNVPENQWVVSSEFGQSVGNIRHWVNNNFSGKQVSDGGYVVLSETKTQCKSVSRTDSFGNVLWQFDPTDKNLPGYSTDWANKTAVEIVQDQGEDFSNIFYVLLIPDEAVIELKDNDGEWQPYSSITANVARQATVVQIAEDLGNYATGSSEWQPRFAVMKSANIDPKVMVDNYPSSWKKASTSSQQPSTPAKKGVSFFSVEQHTSWYDDQTGTSGFVMPWRQYVSNLGNMYGIDGKLLMFGGNGSIFNDPEALSIGLFRINFNLDNPEVVGLPYAFVLSGLLWNLSNARPSVDDKKGGFTGIHYIPSRPIDYTSSIPLGQDKTFSYVPRIAVAGVQPNFTSSIGETPTYLYLAGTITIGQSVNSQQKETSGSPVSVTESATVNFKKITATYTVNPSTTSTRSLHASGENLVSSQAFTSKPTSENSIDPLMLFGTPLSIGALLTFDSNTSSNLYGYTHLMVNGSYYDTNMFSGYQSSGGTTNPYLKPSATGTRPEGVNKADYASELNYSIARFSLFPTLPYGYSLKNVGNLVQFYDAKGKQGYSFQYGISTIGFVAPKFDVKSIVYRAPSMFTLPSIYFKNEDNVDYANAYAEGSYVGKTELLVGTSLYDGSGSLFRNVMDHNWKTEDVASHWRYSETSAQVQPTPSTPEGGGSARNPAGAPGSQTSPEGQQEPNPTPRALPVIEWSRFRGIASSNKNYLNTTWSKKSSDAQRNQTAFDANSIFTVTNRPLLSIFDKNLNSQGIAGSNISMYFGVVNNEMVNGTSQSGDIYIQGSTGNSLAKEKLDICIPSRANYDSSIFITQQDAQKDLTTVTVNPTSETLQFNAPNSQEERKTVLGSGNFKTQLPNSFLQKNISEILDPNKDVPGVGPTETVLKTPFIPEVFDVVQQPQSRDIKIVATNVDYTRQQLTLTAYALNPDTGTYVLMPGNNATSFGSVNVSNFQGFKALASWILPVAISIPILVVALVIGLGVGVGLPAQKNKKMLKLGFELQHKKVDTLTTAVGSVFKKIITNTEQAKKAPQMLKASAPAKPGAPKAPGATAAVRPGAPKPPGATSAVKAGAPRPAAPKPPGTPASK